MGWFWNSDSDKNKNQTDNINTDVVPNQQVHSSFHSYSSSRSCFSDPEDPEYMICKQKINDGKNQTIKETRVKANQELPFASLISPALFNPMFVKNLEEGINQSQQVISDRLSKLDQQLSQDFGNIFNAFMPFFMALDPQGFQKQFKSNTRNFQNSYSQTNNSRQSPQSETNNQHYYSTSYKDTEIKDL